MKNEIFRHFRPTWFNAARAEIEPATHGGISFLFRPVNNTPRYDYWIYIVPESISFSTKGSVVALRDTANRGIKPWGTIMLGTEPILNEAVNSLIQGDGQLPTEVARLAQRIAASRGRANDLQAAHLSKVADTKVDYEKASIW